jgi:hypothetical protein
MKGHALPLVSLDVRLLDFGDRAVRQGDDTGKIEPLDRHVARRNTRTATLHARDVSDCAGCWANRRVIGVGA